MATQVVGTASFTYTVSGSTQVTVNLGTPLHEIRLETAKERRALDTLDKTGREVVSYGGGRAEVEGLVRFHDVPQELVDLIEHGLDKVTLTYKHGSTYTGIACLMIDASRVEPDPDRVGLGEYQTRMRLRRNTTGDWSAIL